MDVEMDVEMVSARLQKATTQWKKLNAAYYDINQKQFVLFTKPVEMEPDAEGKTKIMAECLECGAEYSAENNNLKRVHGKCDKSLQKYNLYVERRIQEVLESANNDMQKLEDVATLKIINSQLKQVANTQQKFYESKIAEQKENYERKIAILENQLKEASMLVKEE